MPGELPETAAERPSGAPEAFAHYVYAIARRDDVEPVLAGEQLPEAIEPPAPLEMVAAGSLAAIVSAVPVADYAEQALAAHLQQLEWTGVRALRHERVVRHFAARATTIPLRFGTIYLQREGVERMLRQRRQELEALVARLHGREEWSVLLYRERARLAAYVDLHSSRLREFDQTAE